MAHETVEGRALPAPFFPRRRVQGRLVAMEVKASSQVTHEDLHGLRAFRACLRRKRHLVRALVLHAAQARPLEAATVALPWGWMVPRRDG